MVTTPIAAEPSPAAARRRPPGWVWLVVAAAMLAAIGIIVALMLVGDDEASPGPEPSTSPSTSPTPPSAEEQAETDLDQLVRDYEAAVNAAFLNSAVEPAPALDDYLRSPALDKDVEQLVNVHSPEGIEVTSHATEVHSVTVTTLDLSADPPTATVEECSSLTAAGTDRQTGEPLALNRSRQLTIWSAVIVEDGRWRLVEAEPQGADTC